MDFLGNLDFKDVGQIFGGGFGMETNFPLNPKPGRVIFKDRRLYTCVDVSGVPLWVPTTQEIDIFQYVQPTAALQWTIQHNLGAALVIVQVYDQNNKVVIPDSIDCSVVNRTTVSFPIPVAGAALIQRGQSVGQPGQTISFEQSFTDTTTAVVNHALGYNPVVVCVNDQGYVVSPVSVQYTSTTSLTVTFAASGNYSVRCI